ncbi:MAG TPA: VCBS repeat-containing protein [Polyangiaceae bacterium]|nr:VCBS repeat-containing protein [Polyangiaceae bacterium]
MKVLRAAVLLGVSTPLVVLACGSDDGKVAPHGAAGDQGDGGQAASGASSGGSSSGKAGSTAAGAGAGGEAPNGGGVAGEGGTAGVGAVTPGGAAGQDAGGAGGAPPEPEPVCGDDVTAGGILCFDAPVPLTLVEGTPTDVAIGQWDGAEGLDVLVAGSGLTYFSNDTAHEFASSTWVGKAGIVLAAGQLDTAGSNLDLLLGQANSGNSLIEFGDGEGVVAREESSYFNSEGVLYNYFVADVAGSPASADIVVTFSNSISVVPTTGTEGEGFLGPIQSSYPASPQDAVLVKLGSAQWLVYSTETNVARQRVTYDLGSITLDSAVATAVGGTASQLDVGDFDEDGFGDLAVALKDSGDLNVLYGSGVDVGGFRAVTATADFLTLTIGTSDQAKTQRDVKVGDFNGDGHADIAVSVQGLDSVAIFSGDGAGAFGEPKLVSTGVGSGPTRLAVGDLNDDAVDDLAVVGTGSNNVIVLLSDP